MSEKDAIGGGRPIRFCPICRQADDHPRHVVFDDKGADVARHMDCCAEAGCPDGTCVALRAGVPAEVVGAEFLAHIQEVVKHDEIVAEFADDFVADKPVVNLEGAL